MNICFLMGRIISDIDFNFIINDKKYNSIAIFKLRVSKNCVLIIKAYNEIADWCYKNLIMNDCISLYGEINSEMEIILQDISLI